MLVPAVRRPVLFGPLAQREGGQRTERDGRDRADQGRVVAVDEILQTAAAEIGEARQERERGQRVSPPSEDWLQGVTMLPIRGLRFSALHTGV
jgi:hypothetical protein